MKKQIKKQIKHWHRRDKRQGLSQRAIVKRHEDPLIEKSGKKYKYEDDYDPYWDVYDSWDDSEYYLFSSNVYDEALSHFNLHHRLLDEIEKPPQTSFEELKKYFERNNEKQKKKYTIANKQFKIEKYVFDHIKYFENIKANNIDEKIAYLRGFADSLENIEFVSLLSKKYDSKIISKAIMLFSPFWLKEPKTITVNGKNSLIKDLLTQYDVPEFLFAEWYRNTENRYSNEDVLRIKWLIWFIIIGQGGSLKKAAKLFNWNIDSRFQQNLFKVPKEFLPKPACIYAKVLSLGGNEIDAQRVLNNTAFVVDITEYIDKNYYKFWHSTVRWIIKYSSEISDDEAEIILLWAMHRYTEVNRDNEEIMYLWKEQESLTNSKDKNNTPPQIRPFSLSGRSVRNVLRESIEYIAQQQICYEDLSWSKHNWDYNFEDTDFEDWKIVELTNSKDLYAEGEAMMHCVASYSGQCVANVSSVFSLTQFGIRTLTIELSPKHKRVIQAYGERNREATEVEKKIIDLWLQNVVL